jgi:TonB family protein
MQRSIFKPTRAPPCPEGSLKVKNRCYRLVGVLLGLCVIGAPARADEQHSIPLRIRVGGKVMQAKWTSHPAPVYPEDAKLHRIQGLVRMAAVIGTDGTIKDLEVMSGKPPLARAAMDAVSRWRYQPTTLNGKPVEVETEIDVNFQLEGVPPDSDTVADRVLTEAWQARNRGDSERAVALMRQAATIAPDDPYVERDLGRELVDLGRYSEAEAAFRQVLQSIPDDARARDQLGVSLWHQQKYDEAAAEFQKVLQGNSLDHDALANLGVMDLERQRYGAAAAEIEGAIAPPGATRPAWGGLAPPEAILHLNLGSAYLGLGQAERATAEFGQAVSVANQPLVWNNVAWAMASHGLDLGHAQQYAERAVSKLSDELAKADPKNLKPESLDDLKLLASAWDTLGWIQFQEGDAARAEKSTNAAWLLGQSPIAAEHLGEIEEKLDKKPEAAKAYGAALFLDGKNAATRARLVALLGDEHQADGAVTAAMQELSTRAVRIPNPDAISGQADVLLTFEPGKVDAVQFLDEASALERLDTAIRAAAYPVAFPDATPVRLFREGNLNCAAGQPECLLVLNALSTTVLNRPPANASGEVTPPMGVYEPAPSYTKKARKSGVEGVVVLSVAIGKDGRVHEARVVKPLGSGLDEEAVKTVRTWRFKPALRDGEPVATNLLLSIPFKL